MFCVNTKGGVGDGKSSEGILDSAFHDPLNYGFRRLFAGGGFTV
ncbi:MAG: hypothetical protein AAF517_27730 [Planctomycetota bacterium]